jgi:methyltransferase FkbM-like protein
VASCIDLAVSTRQMARGRLKEKVGAYQQNECLYQVSSSRKVDVMKIDIEGAEILALEGATILLNQLRKILVEIHNKNLERVLNLILDSESSKWNKVIIFTR